MTTTLVRYRTRPDSSDDNAALIVAVFAELAARSPAGLRYTVLQADDAFVHIARTQVVSSPLPQLQAFQAFRTGLAERCLEPPRVVTAEVLGDFGTFGRQPAADARIDSHPYRDAWAARRADARVAAQASWPLRAHDGLDLRR